MLVANGSAVASDLPVALTSFVGREPQIADLVRHLSRERLLTLVGPGGVGKSRLARAVASQVLAEHQVGVTFVELAGLDDADLVPEVVAMKLGVHARAGQRTLDALIESLAALSEFLIIDNCEHLRGACATLIRLVLHACSSVQILATSRRALRLEGEVVWRVPPLTLPDGSAKALVADFERCEAVRLFVERDRAMVPDFVLTESNVTAVADICRQLDGMPLAIELAAARLSVLSPQQINRRLLDRFQFLTTGRSSDPRHQTLRATMDWSHDLLDNAPRVLLRRLAVFAGGFSLEAAENVCADAARPGRLDACLAIDLLDQLVDQSLVIAEQPPGATDVRYHLLETVREYAAEKLARAGEGAVIRDRHAAWCLSVASPRALGLLVDSAAVARVRPELDNMRAALRWCVANGQPVAGLRLAAALGPFWYAGGYHWEGSRWLTQLLDLPQDRAPTIERAVALGHVGLYAHMQERLDSSRRALQESLALAEQLGEPGVTGMVLQFLGGLEVTTRHLPTAREYYERAIALNRPLPERRPVFIAGLTQLGRLALIEGDIAAAVKHADEILALARAVNEGYTIARALSLRGWIAAHQRDDGIARRYFAQAMTVARQSGLPQLVGNLLVQDAWLDLRAGRLADARNRLIEALLLWHRMGARRRWSSCCRDWRA
jgi:non-specific serine/threonine protein kinase